MMTWHLWSSIMKDRTGVVLKRRRFREFCSVIYRRRRRPGGSENEKAHRFFAVVLFGSNTSYSHSWVFVASLLFSPYFCLLSLSLPFVSRMQLPCPSRLNKMLALLFKIYRLRPFTTICRKKCCIIAPDAGVLVRKLSANPAQLS
jgi:hypothetical protein